MTDTSDPRRLLRLHRSTHRLAASEIEEIAQHAEIVMPEEGDIIQQAECAVDSIYLVCAGRLSLSLKLPSGDEQLVLFVGRDEQVGLLTHLQDEPSGVIVRAAHPSTLIRIPSEAAIDLMRRIPIWGRNLLKSLGPKIRDTILGTKKVRRKRFIVLLHMDSQSRHLTTNLVEQLAYLGEKIGLASDDDPVLQAETLHSLPLLSDRGTCLSIDEIRDRFATWSDADRVVIDCSIENVAEVLPEYLRAAGSAYCICQSHATDDLIQLLQPIVKQSPGTRDKLHIVRVLSQQEQVAPSAPQLEDVCVADFKYHWDGCVTDSIVCTQQAGLRRILHHLRGVTIGLALGGGAARGMAHLGVLSVLNEAGITIDRMSGTSAGALVGIPFCSGMSPEAMTDAFSIDLKPGWLYRMLPYGDALYALAKYRFGGWDPMLRKYLSNWTLDQLSIPFSSVTVDLISAEPVIRHNTDATEAILESINLPGIARPICRDGAALVDGGILDVVPADVLANQEENFIIASDVSSRISFEFAGNQSHTPTEKMKRAGGIAATIRSRTVQDRNIRKIGGSAADVVIEPDVSNVDLADFQHADTISELGRSAAAEAISEIKSELHQIDPQLFRP
ncbi:MAG: patatin-like phospholipase family protein [Planctomycetota bacterium]